MADEKKLKQAKDAYKTLVQMLKDRKWVFSQYDEKLCISCTAQGDDLPIDILFRVDPERLIVSLTSEMPYTVPANKRADLAVAITAANWPMIDGGFDYNYINGKIVFRLTSSFMESLVSEEMFEYMLLVSCTTVDMYNEKFLMIMKDAMTIQDLIKFIEE